MNQARKFGGTAALLLLGGLEAGALAAVGEASDQARCTGEHPSWKDYKAGKEKADQLRTEGGFVFFCMHPLTPAEPIAGENPKPELPSDARGACLSGSVVVQALITDTGKVAMAEVLRETPRNVGFGEKAVEAIKSWRFHPARGWEDGCPLTTYQTILVKFPPDCKPAAVRPSRSIVPVLEGELGGPLREAERS